MSSNPQPIVNHPQGATAAFLNMLTSAGGAVGIAVQVGEVLIPLVLGVIKQIKSHVSGTTVEYTVVISTENAILDSIIASGASDIQSINAELVRQGLPPLAVPVPAPPAP